MHPGVRPKPKEPIVSDEKLFPVVLKKNYVPIGKFEVIGYLKPKIERKDALGRMIMVEPEQFMHGEKHPAPLPGVGFENKLWAGTHIKLPVDEAKGLIASKAAERADDIAA